MAHDGQPKKPTRPDDFYDVQGRFWIVVLSAKNIRPFFGLLFSAITRPQAIQCPISLNAIQEFSIVLLITEFVYDWGKIIIVIIRPRPDWCNLKVVVYYLIHWKFDYQVQITTRFYAKTENN